MADLSWLTEAINKTRDAQLNQQKMVAIALFKQIGQLYWPPIIWT